MSDFSLRDVINAEREAAERINKANTGSEEIRKSTEERVARINAEADERIAAQRRQRIEQTQKENDEFRRGTIQEAQQTVASWQSRYQQRKNDIIERICRKLRGEE